MSMINVLNASFDTKGTKDIALGEGSDVSVAAVHQVVKSLLASRRQGNASTKNKALVSGGGAKPFKQKGTGRARQGSSRSPLQPGGGVAFGPKTRSFEQKINKKMMVKAISSVLIDKAEAGKLFVIDKFESNGKTKDLFKMLSKIEGKSYLIIPTDTDNKVNLAARNMKNAKSIPVAGFSVYEAVKFENLIIEQNALDQLIKRLG